MLLAQFVAGAYEKLTISSLKMEDSKQNKTLLGLATN